MRIYVRERYSTRSKSRINRRKVVGHHVEFYTPTIAGSEWHKQQFGNNWARMMGYNWACICIEGGARCTSAAIRAFKRVHNIKQRYWD